MRGKTGRPKGAKDTKPRRSRISTGGEDGKTPIAGAPCALLCVSHPVCVCVCVCVCVLGIRKHSELSPDLAFACRLVIPLRVWVSWLCDTAGSVSLLLSNKPPGSKGINKGNCTRLHSSARNASNLISQPPNCQPQSVALCTCVWSQ